MGGKDGNVPEEGVSTQVFDKPKVEGIGLLYSRFGDIIGENESSANVAFVSVAQQGT